MDRLGSRAVRFRLGGAPLEEGEIDHADAEILAAADDAMGQ